jgi:methyl-accepting chemotaxis protein
MTPLPWTQKIAAARFLLAMNFKLYRDLRQLKTICSLIADIAALIHALQKERGASNVYLTSAGRQFGDQLAQNIGCCTEFEQRVVSGFAKIDRLTQGVELFSHVGLVLTDLEQLPQHRRMIHDLAIAPKDCFDFYTAAIANLLALVASAADCAADPQISSLLIAYVNFMQGKEFAGQERAIGAAGFGSGRLDSGSYRRLQHLVLAQQKCFATFARYGDPVHLASFHAASANETTEELHRLRDIARRGGLTGALDGVSAAHWFDITTRRIDAFKAIEDRIGQDLKAHCAVSLAEAQRALCPSRSGVSLWQSLMVLLDLYRRRRAAKLDQSVGRGIRLLAENLRQASHEPAPRLVEQAVTLYRRGRSDGGSLLAHQRKEQRAQFARQEMLEDAIHDFGINTDAALEALSTMSMAIGDSARHMSSIATETSESSAAMSTVSRQSLGSIQTIGVAASELSGAIAEINDQAEQSYRFVTAATREAEKTQSTVSWLSEAVTQIGQIVVSIKGVAAQTNLLALNATIEAARAGTAGKGFAVVASEVRLLANHSAEAAIEIDRHVANVQSIARGSIQQMTMICETIKNMDQAIARIARALMEQREATERIARSLQEVSQGTERAADTIDRVAGRAVDTQSMAGRVLEAAGTLATVTGSLQQGIDMFVGKVKQT